MVNHLYGNKNKPLRNEINKQRKEMGIDKFEGLLPNGKAKLHTIIIFQSSIMKGIWQSLVALLILT